jgi:excisionase family DNA binding protein
MAPTFPRRSVQFIDQNPFSFSGFERLLDSSEAASLLRIHPKTLQKMARCGEIEGRHVGRCRRFRASDLNNWLWRGERAG